MNNSRILHCTCKRCNVNLMYITRLYKSRIMRVVSKQKIYWLIDLIWTKSLLNLKSEASRNVLSYVWWILEPFLYMLVFYVVFEMLLNRGGENYTTFLITGLIPWMWFMKSVSGSSGSIINSHALITQLNNHQLKLVG